MTSFEPGTRIALSDGGEVEIAEKIGEGGQGTVYKAKFDGRPYALKWYHPGKLKDPAAFRDNLWNNIKDPERSMGSDPRFLWPKFLTEERDSSFGYVMDLRPGDYTDFPAILNRRRDGQRVEFTSTETMIAAALNFVSAFSALHRKGLSYQDLNDGNFFVNLTTGSVLICDNDNVTPDGKVNSGGIGGKPGYMAPEIVRGEAHPSERTDCHSLAVVLFKLFFMHNPLQGKEFEKWPCMTEERELELFGTNPVFIYDPDDDSNRPVDGVHHNVIKLWPRFPEFFREAFVRSFAQGMKDPQRRITEYDWQKMLIRLRDEWYVPCVACGQQILLHTGDKAAGLSCDGCGAKASWPRTLSVKKGATEYRVPLFPGKKLYAWHTLEASDDYLQVTGEVVMNKNNPSLWGIKNVSGDVWYMIPPAGARKDIAPGGVVPIGAGVKVVFNGLEGMITE